MTDEFAHLGPNGLKWVTLDAEERIARIRSGPFTDNPRCRHLLDLMEERRKRPKGSFKPNVLIWGESGQGKSMVCNEFVRNHQPVFDEKAGVMRTPVVKMEMPPICDLRWIFSELLLAIKAPIPSGRPDMFKVFDRIRDLYGAIGVTQILIDEFHNVFRGTAPQQHAVLTAIRYLTNQLEIPLVLFGTLEAREALLKDRQLLRRFHIEELPAWQAGPEFEALVGSILRALPLRKPSRLTKRSLRALVGRTSGVTAHVFEIISNLAIAAIIDGTEHIRPEDLIARCDEIAAA